ncbi:molybdopterin molybdotransferase MoeA [Sphingomonas piscis]|uniref:Molybdopterin molybdenumtransferase n=1 Tax=Sphingomonas piscis TaxID=2714943 RepID=A0A6G7YS02_9SPHN|nr:molybdopterin molybdotransferase MoeA [Sphingomonas piscis]QIK79512.1 molybdopterin molybdotransferase MoeA [Sphingomonas piscis]
MISFDEAVAVLAEVARPLGSERIPLAKAHGRVLAEPVTAALDSPRRDVSAMDGYAVASAELANLPTRLRVAKAVFAGDNTIPRLTAGECARIFTGGAVPDGADRVVVQEAVGRDGDWAIFNAPLSPATHIRKQGFDFRTGDTLLEAGDRLHARALVSAAAADQAEVSVFRRPRFAILGTGDELAEPGSARASGGTIPDSISLAVEALGRDWGGECLGRRLAPDQLAELQRLGGELLQGVDLLVVTGGASVGERDFAKTMFGPEGLDLLFSKVAIKPGKPAWLGRASGRLVLGLPGNPTSAMVTARLFLAPLLAGLGGRDSAAALDFRSALLDQPVAAEGDRESFVRARWVGERVAAIGNQDSGVQGALASADLLIRRPAASAAAQSGDKVSVLPF